MRKFLILLTLISLLPVSAAIDLGNNVQYIPGSSNLGIGVTSANTKLTVNGATALREISTQGATANYGKLYVSSGNSKLYFKDDGGTAYNLTNGSSSATLANKLSDFASTSSSELTGVISDETGTAGNLVFSTSPTLVTPTLGVASATTINKVTLTAPATGSTLTIADGKTLTASNTLTFTGTDSSSVAFGTGGTAAYTANNLSVFAATTSAQLAGVLSDETGTGYSVFNGSPSIKSPILSKVITLNGNTMSIGSLSQGSILFSKVAGSLSALDNGASSNHKTLKVNGNALVWEADSTAGGDATTLDAID